MNNKTGQLARVDNHRVYAMGDSDRPAKAYQSPNFDRQLPQNSLKDVSKSRDLIPEWY
jgi:hypothetical protein